jgi:hypothetical protein
MLHAPCPKPHAISPVKLFRFRYDANLGGEIPNSPNRRFDIFTIKHG